MCALVKDQTRANEELLLSDTKEEEEEQVSGEYNSSDSPQKILLNPEVMVNAG